MLPRRSAYFIFLGLYLWGGVRAQGASLKAVHPLHLSSAEIEYNPETRRLEVAMQIFPEDLDEVLSSRAGETIRIDETEGVNRLIREYLQENIWVGDSRAKELQWIGKQVSFRETWLYFEIPVKGAFDPSSIQNRIFFELFDDQVNQLVVRRRLGPPMRYATRPTDLSPEDLRSLRRGSSWTRLLRTIAWAAKSFSRDASFASLDSLREENADSIAEKQGELVGGSEISAIDLQTLEFLVDHLETLRSEDDELGVARCLLSLTRLSRSFGDLRRASKHLAEATSIIRRVGLAFERAQTAEAAAFLAADLAEKSLACTWLGTADRVRNDNDLEKSRSESETQEVLMGVLRGELGAEEFSKLWALGQHGSIEEQLRAIEEFAMRQEKEIPD